MRLSIGKYQKYVEKIWTFDEIRNTIQYEPGNMNVMENNKGNI